MTRKIAIVGASKDTLSNTRILDEYNNDKITFVSINHISYSTSNGYDYYIEHSFFSSYEIQTLAKKTAYTWYRDNNGIDRYPNHFSFGIAMQNRLELVLSNIIKYYFSFKKLLLKYDIVIIPEDLNDNLEAIFTNLPDNYKKHKYSSSDFENLNTMLDALGRCTNIIHVNKYSPIMYKLQKSLCLQKKQKTLIFPDWTYNHYRHKDYLYQNSKDIRKGFYFRNKNPNITKLRNKFPMNIEINTRSLESVKDNMINNQDKKNLSEIFIKTISNEYSKSIKNLCVTYAILRDLLVDYEPKQVVCPTFHHHFHTITAEIAREMNIKTSVVLDGYAPHIDILYYSKDSSNLNYLFDNYVFTGSLAKDLTNKYFPEITGDLIKMPLSDLIANTSQKNENNYDAIIMTAYPLYGNPNSYYDLRFQYVIDIIKVLNKKNYKNIVIKVKNANREALAREVSLLENFLMAHSLDNMEICTGNLYDIVNDTKIIVGQATTALIESNIANTPYYIYEPSYCGLSDNDIERSVFKDTYYARTSADLEANIAMSRDSILDRNKLVDGSTMTDILN